MKYPILYFHFIHVTPVNKLYLFITILLQVVNVKVDSGGKR